MARSTEPLRRLGKYELWERPGYGSIAEALNVPVPESLVQPYHPPDFQNMPTQIGNLFANVGSG